MMLVSQKWEVAPRDPTKVDLLQPEIEYYTNLILTGGEYGDPYDITTELVAQDLLDTPIGGCAEIVREFDDAGARVIGVLHMDAGTLFPTYDPRVPIAQKSPYQMQPVLFPRYAVSRCYISPRTELARKGWGMAPPEKIYLALELLARGDKYYANLLLDTPPVGILDLGDIEPTWAEAWLESWRGLLNGIDPFKIPVLSGHTTAATFIKFGNNPGELMFDKVIQKYDAVVAAGYGISLGDTGSDTSSGGSSLSGVLRQERRTMRTGSGTVRTKIEGFWNRVLPPSLKFNSVDRDEELMTSRGRARLASATALEKLQKAGFISIHEGRDQLSADGLMTVPLIGMPKDVTADPTPNDHATMAPSDQLGDTPVAPSMGGEGSISTRWICRALRETRKIIPQADPLEYVQSVFRGEAGSDAYKDVNSLLVRDPEWAEQFDFTSISRHEADVAAAIGRDSSVNALTISSRYAELLVKLLLSHAQTLPAEASDLQVVTAAKQLRADFNSLRGE